MEDRHTTQLYHKKDVICDHVFAGGGGSLLVSSVPMHEQKKTMRKGTFSSWVVRSPVIILDRKKCYYFCRKMVCFLLKRCD